MNWLYINKIDLTSTKAHTDKLYITLPFMDSVCLVIKTVLIDFKISTLIYVSVDTSIQPGQLNLIYLGISSFPVFFFNF